MSLSKSKCWYHRYQKSQNRLLKVCCVPATRASFPRVSFFFSFLFLLQQPFTELIKQTRQAVYMPLSSLYILRCLWLVPKQFFTFFKACCYISIEDFLSFQNRHRRQNRHRFAVCSPVETPLYAVQQCDQNHTNDCNKFSHTQSCI